MKLLQLRLMVIRWHSELTASTRRNEFIWTVLISSLDSSIEDVAHLNYHNVGRPEVITVDISYDDQAKQSSRTRPMAREADSPKTNGHINDCTEECTEDCHPNSATRGGDSFRTSAAFCTVQSEFKLVLLPHTTR